MPDASVSVTTRVLFGTSRLSGAPYDPVNLNLVTGR